MADPCALSSLAIGAWDAPIPSLCMAWPDIGVLSMPVASWPIVPAAHAGKAPNARHAESVAVANVVFMMFPFKVGGESRRLPQGEKGASSSASTEPVVALVFAVAAVEGVAHEDRLDVLGVLVAKLGGDAQLDGEVILGWQRPVVPIQGNQRLGVQGGRHVDAGVVAVGAVDADVARVQVGADHVQEIAQAGAAPFSDGAPAFHADVARDLRVSGQRTQFGQRPWP